VQTLLLLSHRQNTGVGFAPNVTSAITFSAWLVRGMVRVCTSLVITSNYQ
jgi:hypothetical protein